MQPKRVLQRSKKTQPVRFKLLEVESGLFEIYRGRVKLNRRLFPIRRAALVLYLLAEDDDLVMIHALGERRTGRDGSEFKANERNNQDAILEEHRSLDRVSRTEWTMLMREIGILD